MLLRKYKPITPSLRSLVQIDRTGLWKGDPIKKLTRGLTEKAGRNSRGKITAYHRGGGHKKKYRFVEYRRGIDISSSSANVTATVLRIEYDPNRTSFIALIRYDDGRLSYILAPNEVKPGMRLVCGTTADVLLGNTLPLKSMPIGTLIHNIEYTPGKGGQVVRSAGTYAQLLSKNENGYCLVRLPSGETRLFSSQCQATIGVLSNIDHKNRVIGKAGRSRWLGKQPIVRGVAMNPVDHPHGGGQGKTSGGRPSVTPWSWPTKGQPTRSKNKHNTLIVQRARRKK